MAPSPRLGPILLVDDDPEIRDAFRQTLEVEGYSVVEAGDGATALSYVRTSPPPLILLDWNMTPMNGQQFMDAFAEEPSYTQTPVILVTADVRAPHKTVPGAFAAIVPKPVKLEVLFELIERYVIKT